MADMQHQQNLQPMHHSKGITVLSLFNGMSTAHKALDDLGIQINKYYSSEIKKAALKITKYHYPDTIELGDIRNWKKWNIDFSSIDIITSGSPCKDLSKAGNRKGINGSNSSLFFDFVEILNHTKKYNPNVFFFQENVASATYKDIKIMSDALGIFPIKICSSLVTAQIRTRYYWSNIKVKKFGIFNDLVTDIPQPKDHKIFLKDIITYNHIDKKQTVITSGKNHDIIDNEKIINRDLQKYLGLVYTVNNEIRVKTNTKKGYDVFTDNDCLDVQYPTSITRRGRITKGKSPCIMEGERKLYIKDQNKIRKLNIIEMTRLQGFPDDYCKILSRNQAVSVLGDGWTLPIVKHFFNYLPYKKNKV